MRRPGGVVRPCRGVGRVPWGVVGRGLVGVGDRYHVPAKRDRAHLMPVITPCLGNDYWPSWFSSDCDRVNEVNLLRFRSMMENDGVGSRVAGTSDGARVLTRELWVMYHDSVSRWAQTVDSPVFLMGEQFPDELCRRRMDCRLQVSKSQNRNYTIQILKRTSW